MSDSDDLPFRDDPDGPGPEKPGHEGGPRSSYPEAEQEKKRLFERVMPEILKRVVERAVESGASRLAEGPENLRNFVQEMKLPKEVLHYLYTQIDDTKNGLYRVVAKEIRDVLEQTQFADEITQVLTSSRSRSRPRSASSPTTPVETGAPARPAKTGAPALPPKMGAPAPRPPRTRWRT